MSPLAPLAPLALLALTGVCSCRTSDCSYLDLLTHLNLTATHNTLVNMRPVKNWTTPTLVHVDMLLLGILQDEKTQTFTSHIWITTLWTNEFLTWNLSDFCGIDKLMVPRSSLWIPNVVIEEDVSDSGTIQNEPLVSLSPEGSVSAFTRRRLTATCLLIVNLFPFDQQRCNFTFSIINSDKASIMLGTVHNDTVLTKTSGTFMVTQGEWELNKMEIFKFRNKRSGHPERLQYTVTISRRPLLYVVIFIFPLMFFVCLDVASFFISEARGEKLSFKVTVLLSISVLLLILKDMMPSTEAYLPMIAVYCIGIFGLVGFSLLEAMLISFLHDLDDYCKAQSPDDSQKDIPLEEDFYKAEETPEKGAAPPDRAEGRDLLKLILEEVRTTRQEVGGRPEEEMRPGRYRRLGDIIDRVFFSLYLLTALGFLAYMYTSWISQIL
ncbi:5-hydroxytryptamine receptor 3A-like isoform 2-T2 [Spinachia spinachia]